MLDVIFTGQTSRAPAGMSEGDWWANGGQGKQGPTMVGSFWILWICTGFTNNGCWFVNENFFWWLMMPKNNKILTFKIHYHSSMFRRRSRPSVKIIYEMFLGHIYSNPWTTQIDFPEYSDLLTVCQIEHRYWPGLHLECQRIV